MRPGVDIVSKTPDGDLVVQGDLDLSGLRYASLNPRFQQTGVRGSGEVGSLLLRAGGDLNIYGSINDGFAPPPATKDDKGWVLLPGRDINGSDVIVPGTGRDRGRRHPVPGRRRAQLRLARQGLQSASPIRACPWPWPWTRP